MEFAERTKGEIAGLLTKLREGDIWQFSANEAIAILDRVGEKTGKPGDEILSMRLRSLVAELADRRGWWSDVEVLALKNLDAVRARFYSKIKEIPPPVGKVLAYMEDDWHWYRQAGWLLLQDARSVHRSDERGKRSSEDRWLAAEEALGMDRKLQGHLAILFPLPELSAFESLYRDHELLYRNYELLYRVSFNIARHLQTLERYTEAEGELTVALRNCCLHRDEIAQEMRLLDPEESGAQARRRVLEEKQKFTLFNTTVVIANIGRIDVQRGRLRESIPQLLIARTLLLDSKDIVMSGFVDLQLGSVYRQLGTASSTKADASKLLNPEKLLESAIESFHDAGHRQLEARARLELAQHLYGLATYTRNTAECKKRLKAAKDWLETETRHEKRSASGRAPRIDRWDAQRQLLLARIERVELDVQDETERDLGRVVQHTEEALGKCDQVGEKDVMVVARLVLAELSIDTAKFDEALRYCEKVEEMNPQDTADKAWLYILSAYAWMKQGDWAAAEFYSGEWKKIEPQVQNFHIQKKAENILHKMRLLNSRFHIVDADGKDFDIKSQAKELKEFLVKSAEQFGTLQKQADKLGITRQALANLRSKMAKEKRRKDSKEYPSGE